MDQLLLGSGYTLMDRRVHLSGGSWSGEKDKQTSKDILSPWGQFYPLGGVLGKSISDDSEWEGPGVPKGLSTTFKYPG